MAKSAYVEPEIRIVGVAVLDDQGRLVLVGRRKLDASLASGVVPFTYVGGGIDEGETVEAAAQRELKEEIGITPALEDLVHVGNYPVFLEEAQQHASLDIMFYDAGKAGTAHLIGDKSCEDYKDTVVDGVTTPHPRRGKLVDLIRVDETEIEQMLERSIAASNGVIIRGYRFLLPNHIVFRDVQRKLAARGINLLRGIKPAAEPALPVARPAPARRASPWAAALTTVAAFALGCLATVSVSKIFAPSLAVAASFANNVQSATKVALPCDGLDMRFDMGPLGDNMATMFIDNTPHELRLLSIPERGFTIDPDSMAGLPTEARVVAATTAVEASKLYVPGRPRPTPEALAREAGNARQMVCGA